MSEEKNQQLEILGAKVTGFRRMTEAELEGEGWEDWHGTAFVLEFDNGLKCYASQDDEGNGPGTLFWHDGEKGLIFMPNGVETQ